MVGLVLLKFLFLFDFDFDVNNLFKNPLLFTGFADLDCTLFCSGLTFVCFRDSFCISASILFRRANLGKVLYFSLLFALKFNFSELDNSDMYFSKSSSELDCGRGCSCVFIIPFVIPKGVSGITGFPLLFNLSTCSIFS